MADHTKKKANVKIHVCVEGVSLGLIGTGGGQHYLRGGSNLTVAGGDFAALTFFCITGHGEYGVGRTFISSWSLVTIPSVRLLRSTTAAADLHHQAAHSVVSGKEEEAQERERLRGRSLAVPYERHDTKLLHSNGTQIGLRVESHRMIQFAMQSLSS